MLHERHTVYKAQAQCSYIKSKLPAPIYYQNTQTFLFSDSYRTIM